MSQTKSKISIIIASYNQDKELNNLIKLIQKTGKLYEGEYEIIVISDGKDITFDKDINENNFKYFKFEKNSGSGKARDFGVKNSRGPAKGIIDYVIFFIVWFGTTFLV